MRPQVSLATLDQLVEYALANPTRASASRRIPLAMTLPPQPMHRSAKERSVARIPSALREQMASVIDGAAPWPMTLLGAVGAGKTCAALALCDHVYRSMYESFAGHCDLLRMAQEGKLEWYSNGQGGKTTAPQVWKGYRDAPLVVLDEIGSREKVSDFQYSCLYDMRS